MNDPAKVCINPGAALVKLTLRIYVPLTADYY